MDKRILWSELGCPAPGEGIQGEASGLDPERTYLNSEVLDGIKRTGCKDAWLVFRCVHMFSTTTVLHLIDFIPIL